jgi:hypothetical protein
VLARRKEVSAAQQVKICLRVIPANFFDNVFDANHKNRSQESEVRSQNKRKQNLLMWLQPYILTSDSWLLLFIIARGDARPESQASPQGVWQV